MNLSGDEVRSCLRSLIKSGEKTISLDALMQILEKHGDQGN